MTDSSPIPDAELTDSEESTSHGVLATVLLLIVVLILVLIFWRSCDSNESTPDTSTTGGSIQQVEGLEVEPGGVAVWVKPDASLDEVLERNGLAGASVAAMGDGTFVVGVGQADVEDVVARLSQDPGLFDAGFLYIDE